MWMFKNWDEPLKMPTKKQFALTVWVLVFGFLCMLCLLFGWVLSDLCVLSPNNMFRPEFCW